MLDPKLLCSIMVGLIIGAMCWAISLRPMVLQNRGSYGRIMNRVSPTSPSSRV